VIGLVYKAYPNGCRLKYTFAKAKALPCEGALALVNLYVILLFGSGDHSNLVAHALEFHHTIALTGGLLSPAMQVQGSPKPCGVSAGA